MPAALLGLHAVLAFVAPLVGRRLGRRVLLLCALGPAATTAWVLAEGSLVLRGESLHTHVTWVPSVGLHGDFKVDAFALLMVLLVSGIGTLIFGYAAAYFPATRRDVGGFAGWLTAFAGAMLGLVLADNLILMFVFWELTSITSFMLIGTDHRSPAARSAASQALLTTGAGGLVLLGGMVLLGQAAGTYSLSALVADPPGGAAASAGVVLVLVGAFTKSAQVPFHAWLPAAMAAPTPVSAYLHSATMVKAGVYVVARFSPAFALLPGWRPLVIGVGIATMLVGAYRALRQHDAKLLLAYGTVSQLGFMIVMFGLGTADASFAAVTLILAHGLFKAALFMVVGAVDVQTGTRDIRELSGLRHRMPVTFAVSCVAVASMAGLPPLLGFIAKEAAYEGVLAGGFGAVGPLAVAGIVVGSALTVAYSARFLRGVFLGSRPAGVVRDERLWLVAPAALLSVATLVTGAAPFTADALVNGAAVALHPEWNAYGLSLWHGFNVALALSVVTVAIGGGLHAARTRVELWQARAPATPSATGGYDMTWRAVLAVARRTTGVVQNGSLPVYSTVILLTAVTLPGAVLLSTGEWPAQSYVVGDWLQAGICLLTIVAATGIAAAARRFTAVLLLGAVGYSVAALFVLHGAPDLALTQMLIETLSLVLFVLVLRHLPPRFGRRPQRIDRAVRFGTATLVGFGVFVFALFAAGARTATPVSAEYVARALPEAKGRNIVNVILVDFRALDTLGEIVVLVTAALGISSLVLAGRLSRSSRRESEREAP